MGKTIRGISSFFEKKEAKKLFNRKTHSRFAEQRGLEQPEVGRPLFARSRAWGLRPESTEELRIKQGPAQTHGSQKVFCCGESFMSRGDCDDRELSFKKNLLFAYLPRPPP
ncbi:MAG: hypothetical protein ACI4LE_06900, partial [Faecalibacterium sp.]